MPGLLYGGHRVKTMATFLRLMKFPFDMMIAYV